MLGFLKLFCCALLGYYIGYEIGVKDGFKDGTERMKNAIDSFFKLIEDIKDTQDGTDSL